MANKMKKKTKRLEDNCNLTLFPRKATVSFFNFLLFHLRFFFFFFSIFFFFPLLRVLQRSQIHLKEESLVFSEVPRIDGLLKDFIR